MGRRKAQMSRIRAIHYKLGDSDEVYLLDHNGKHIDKQLEKIDKSKQFKYKMKSDINEMLNNNQHINNEFQLPKIIKSPIISIHANEESKNNNQKTSHDFFDTNNRFPAASLMWVNNPEYSKILSDNV